MAVFNWYGVNYFDPPKNVINYLSSIANNITKVSWSRDRQDYWIEHGRNVLAANGVLLASEVSPKPEQKPDLIAEAFHDLEACFRASLHQCMQTHALSEHDAWWSLRKPVYVNLLLPERRDGVLQCRFLPRHMAAAEWCNPFVETR